ncbi:DUF72 domain-containing protein [Pseudomonas sp. MPC6]|jgi:uncharacterized protein YecE (DUF72 family)|uniref:DUF72 domain-containing protein n=1 Tax=unclassified Pseudomonas TaxID=196821 RepID=UPI0011104D56|nr:DUF72 domain-containing protein [Pseudomonas sp. MPC6]QCY14877.1 DUF72 domain-containing protein [Pseudomonas sp. MPC6]
MAAIHIGISGWRYTPWRGDFYPKGLTQKRELQFASRAVNSIEINGSFYALQRPERYAQWYAETPTGFVFSVKAQRFITHIRRLRDIHTPLANFFASGVLELWHQGKQPSDPQLIAPQQKPKVRKSREVFCYFDNDIKVRAPFDARSLLQRLHLDTNLATAPGEPAAEGVLP